MSDQQEISLTLSAEPYMWIGRDGGWKTGRKVLTLDGQPQVIFKDCYFVLLMEPKGNVLSWVPAQKLRLYEVTPEFK